MLSERKIQNKPNNLFLFLHTEYQKVSPDTEQAAASANISDFLYREPDFNLVSSFHLMYFQDFTLDKNLALAIAN